MEFETQEEAFQFMADEIGKLSERVYNLESQNMAQKSAISALVACVGQIPPLSIDMITTILNDHADTLVESMKEAGEDTERAEAVAEELRAIGFDSDPRPVFEIIEGGRKD